MNDDATVGSAEKTTIVLDYARLRPVRRRRRRRWIIRKYVGVGFGWGIWAGFGLGLFGGINPITSFLAIMLGLIFMIFSERTARATGAERGHAEDALLQRRRR
ncbi:hypothetical protein [Fontivita pretiosa]|uniref:hypothetical protein n=1 Tax=Fontivita pretiosa TaxID=2989684 RepID=UPI003D1674B8